MTSRSVSTAQVLTGTAAGLAMLYFMRGIMIPFVIALVLAVLVNALVRFIQNRWAKAPPWAVATLAGVVIIILAAGSIFVLAQGMVQMVAQGPALLARLDEITLDIGRSLHLHEDLHLKTLVGQVSVPQLAGSVLSGVQGFATGLLLMIVYFGFMLAGRQRILRKVGVAAGSSRRSAAIREVSNRIVENIETYIWVQTITGVMLTAAAVVVMLAVGLNNVLFWAVIFFLLTFIPNIGITVGSIAPALFALIQFPTYWQAITIFVVVQVVATIVGNLIYPRLQAETQNIDPVVTILALSFWSVLWGLPGAFLAVPLTLMGMIVFAQFKGTYWIAALLSNDGKPAFHSSRPDPEGGRRPK